MVPDKWSSQTEPRLQAHSNACKTGGREAARLSSRTLVRVTQFFTILTLLPASLTTRK